MGSPLPKATATEGVQPPLHAEPPTPMSGLGERGQRLRVVARMFEPPPAIPPFYVQVPDEDEIRAVGWYARQTREGPPIFLGHNAVAAEVWMRRQLEIGTDLGDSPKGW